MSSYPPLVTPSKVFDEYRQLKTRLESMNVGSSMTYNVVAEFPRTYSTSAFGISLSEDQLRQR
jgi:hypothetical protein